MISLTGVTKIYAGKRQVAALESVDLEVSCGGMVSRDSAARKSIGAR